LILGIPPMSQYDAAAIPMWRCLTAAPDTKAFASVPANIDLTEKNLAWNKLSEKSAGFDFTKEDRVPDLEFSEVIWQGVKGIDAIMPAPKRSAFLKFDNTKDDD